MLAGIVPWRDQVHVCVLVDRQYRHFTFLRTQDAPELIAQWLSDGGVDDAITAAPPAEAFHIAQHMLSHGLNAYTFPMQTCLDIAFAARARAPTPSVYALVTLRAFLIPRWRKHVVPLT